MQKSKIHATIEKAFLEKWLPLIIEGQCYQIETFMVQPNHGDYKSTHHTFKIVFNRVTNVKKVEANIEYHAFDFLPFQQILSSTNDTDSFLIGEKARSPYFSSNTII